MMTIDTTRRGEFWVCYACPFGLAVELFRGNTLDDCRAFAKRMGWDGIVIGSPSMPWAG